MNSRGEYLLNLHLYNGYGPDGQRFGAQRVTPPSSLARFEDLWLNPLPEDIFDDDHE